MQLGMRGSALLGYKASQEKRLGTRGLGRFMTYLSPITTGWLVMSRSIKQSFFLDLFQQFFRGMKKQNHQVIHNKNEQIGRTSKK